MPPNLTLAELHIRVPKSLIEFIKAKKRQRRTRRADGRAATGRTVTCAIASCHVTCWRVMKARDICRPDNFGFWPQLGLQLAHLRCGGDSRAGRGGGRRRGRRDRGPDGLVEAGSGSRSSCSRRRLRGSAGKFSMETRKKSLT